MTNEVIVIDEVEYRDDSASDLVDESIYNIIGENNLSKHMRLVSDDIADLTEIKIRNKAKPTRTDEHLRIALWEEIAKAEKDGRTINQANVWKGVCRSSHWEKLIVNKPHKLAFLMCPVRNYDIENKLIHYQGQQRMLEILSKSPVGANGKMDKGLAQLQLKAYKMIDDKIKGSAVQRVQKHITAGDEVPKDIKELDELEAKVAELEARKLTNG